MKKNSLSAVCLSLGLIVLIQLSSCVVVTTPHDNGKHKGWNKNPNNPHNPNTTNPGHTKGKK